MGKDNKNNSPENDSETSDKPLKDIRISINEFGQIVKDIPTEEINEFLNKEVPDRKLNEDGK
ncbi:MAG: hypothetical protein IT269_06045 [Saprospiraceae bacterium]|nr:hypothetical protein [Saprospiraceae bacterium]